MGGAFRDPLSFASLWLLFLPLLLLHYCIAWYRISSDLISRRYETLLFFSLHFGIAFPFSTSRLLSLLLFFAWDNVHLANV